MPNLKHNFCPEKVNVILSTYPSKNWIKFDEEVDDYFVKYSDGVNSFFNTSKGENSSKGSNIGHYYKVLRYHVFGVYDVAYITLTESDKFAQKLFSPLSSNIIAPSSYQINTGITYPIDPNFKLGELFEALKSDKKEIGTNTSKNSRKTAFISGKYKYCLICNLKLNSGHLFGGNMQYFRAVEKMINEIICNGKKKTPVNKYILTRSFSWNDITLTIFDDCILRLFVILKKIRGLTLKKIDGYKKMKTLYKEIYIDEKIKNSHVFIETQSYLGVEFDMYHGDPIEDHLTTQIEYKIKTGHEKKVYEILTGNGGFEKDSLKFHFGKTDLSLIESSDSLSSNQKVTKIYRDNEIGLHSHVRRLKTKVLFDLKTNGMEYSDAILDFSDKLAYFIITNEEITSVNKELKKIMIPRHLRQKVIKVLQSYNNGILDPVLTSSFQDFHHFIVAFESIITKGLIKNSKVKDNEEIISKYIRSYEKAYQSRTLNSYLYEEMSDIDIDYQSSIQKLLSIYNSIAINESKMYGKIDGWENGRIVNANLKNTVSNANSINFNIHHLTSPELVIVSLHKEILNPTIKENIGVDLFSKIRDKLSDKAVDIWHFENIEENDNDSLLRNVSIDLQRVFLTFGGNMDLYYYYSWFFNIQNASIYDSSGFINEVNFQVELKRILLVYYILKPSELNSLYLPIIELADEWAQHFEPLKNALIGSAPFDVNSIYEYIKSIPTDGGLSAELIAPILSSKNRELIDWDLPSYKTTDYHAPYQKLLSYTENASSLYSLYQRIIDEITFSELNFASTYRFYSVLYRIISFKYIERFYEMNNKSLYLLKRNLNNSTPLMKFNKFSQEKVKCVYLMDSHGGIFFNNSSNLNKYYSLRDDFFNVLFDLNLVLKNIVFKERINKRSSDDEK